MNILVTGANGFVGRAVFEFFSNRKDYSVRGSVRSTERLPTNSDRIVPVGEVDADTRWEALLENIDAIVHTIARVHVMRDEAANPIDEFRKVNVDGTLNLGRQALDAGVRRFIFLSSIKVNGEVTAPGNRFAHDDDPRPIDPYGRSKLEAEQGLRELAADGDMEWTILRPPLVYGPGVKANFFNMMRWLRRGVPLPFSMVRNQRSLVALDNLVDLIATCIDSESAANQVLLVSDGRDLSTVELLRLMGRALDRPARLFPCPVSLLRAMAVLVGKKTMAQRLLDSLQVDISYTRKLLDWEPPVGIEQAMQKTADYFLRHQGLA